MSRKDCGGLDYQPSLFRVDAGDSECQTLQSIARSHHRSGAHPRDRNRVLPLSPNPRATEEGSESKTVGRGNDGLWKAWKANPRLPTLPTAVANPATSAGFTHSHRTTTNPLSLTD